MPVTAAGLERRNVKGDSKDFTPRDFSRTKIAKPKYELPYANSAYRPDRGHVFDERAGFDNFTPPHNLKRFLRAEFGEQLT